MLGDLCTPFRMARSLSITGIKAMCCPVSFVNVLRTPLQSELLLLWCALHVACILLTTVKCAPPCFNKLAVEGPLANALVHTVVYTAHPLLQLVSR